MGSKINLICYSDFDYGVCKLDSKITMSHVRMFTGIMEF